MGIDAAEARDKGLSGAAAALQPALERPDERTTPRDEPTQRAAVPPRALRCALLRGSWVAVCGLPQASNGTY